MQITVRIPSPLRPFSAGHGRVELTLAEGERATVAAALAALCQRYPGVGARVLDDQGAVREHVNVFLNGESIRALEGLASPLRGGDELAILPAVSGG